MNTIKRIVCLALLLALLCGDGLALEKCKLQKETDETFTVQIQRKKPAPDSWFKKTWIMGDSVSESLANYEVIPNLKVFHKTGQSPRGALRNHHYVVDGKYLTMAERMVLRKPQKLLLMLGSNGIDHEKLSSVKQEYHELVDYLIENLPGCEIYLLAVTPVAPVATKRYPKLSMANIQSFNEEMMEIAKTHGLLFSGYNGTLCIELPSGRALCYREPEIMFGVDGFSIIMYAGMNKDGKWDIMQGNGAKFLRDIVQGLARDVLLDAMQRLTDANYPVVLHLANKVVVEREEPAALMAVSAIMEQSPHWAKALQLTTQGYACNRYLEKKQRPSRR